MNVATVILAAGKGKRMLSDKPKCLQEIANYPVIKYILDTAKHVKSQKIILVIQPSFEIIEDYVKKINPNIQFCYQTEQKGTGHALLQTKELLKDFKGIISVMYGDTPFIKPETLQKMFELVNDHKKISTCILGFEFNEPNNYGRLITDGNNHVERIIEFNDATQNQRDTLNVCNSGVVCIKSEYCFELLDEINDHNSKKEFYLTDIVKIADRKKLKTNYLLCDGNEVIGVNSLEELTQMEDMFQKQLRTKFLKQGLRMLMPETIMLTHDLTFGRDVTIKPYCVIGRNVSISDIRIVLI